MAKRRTRVKMSVGKILALKPDEIEKMSTTKLKAVTTILNSAANKRVKRAEKLGTESAVIDKAKQGGRFVTPRFGKKTPEEEQRSKILSSFMRARDFMTKETSSTRGVKKTQKKVIKQFIKQAKKITLPSGSGEEYTPWFMDLKKIDEEKINELVWKSVDKFAEANPLTKEGRYRVANVAYELTFFAAGIFCFIYTVFIKKQPIIAKEEGPKYTGAIFETIGQFAYIYALADSEHVAMSAPIISSYCAVSVIWSRLFLKEKLSWKHYAAVCLTIAGIIIMGVFDM